MSRSRAAREAEAGVKIAPTYPQALEEIASAVAAWMEASTLDDLNIPDDMLTDAERDRYLRAYDEVQRRLWAIGKRRRVPTGGQAND